MGGAEGGATSGVFCHIQMVLSGYWSVVFNLLRFEFDLRILPSSTETQDVFICGRGNKLPAYSARDGAWRVYDCHFGTGISSGIV